MTYSVVVNSGCILLMSKALPSICRQDVLDTVLFAQLAAEEDFPNGEVHVQWSHVFSSTLAACGWKVHDEGSTLGIFPAAGSGDITVAHAVHAAFQSSLSSEQRMRVTSVLCRVAQWPELSVAARVLREQSILEARNQCGGPQKSCTGIGIERLRLLIGIVEDDGFLTLATVFFETYQPINDQFFGQVFALSELAGGVKTSFFHSRFSVDEYSEIRENTVQWLGARRHSLCVEAGEHDLLSSH